MKRLIAFAAVLLMAAPLFALDDANRDRRDDRRAPTVVDEVIRMSEAGVAENAMIDYVRNVREPIEVTSDDLIALTNAHVSDAVIRELQADARANRNVRRTTRAVVVAPYGYPYYYPSYYSSYYPYYYDPFFYPRFSIGFGFGFGGPRFIGGGHFRHR